MDDGFILNIDLDYTKSKRTSANEQIDKSSTTPQSKPKQSRPLPKSRDEDSEPPRKRQRVLSTLKPRIPKLPPTSTPATTRQPLEEQEISQASKHTGHVISSLFTSNPVVQLPPIPIASTKAQTPSNAPLKDDSTFEGLGLNPLLIAHLRDKMNIAKPTAVQRASLSAILQQTPIDRRDLFIQSQTGSGKTLSFLLPIIHDLLPLSSLSYIDRSVGTLAIIVAPTRELVQQISEVLNTLLQMRLRESDLDASDGDLGPRLTRWLVSGLLVGGGTRTHDKARLRKGLPILVATPGRLLDHLQHTESFKVAKCRWLILDEADRLMELGFHETLEGIIKALDGRRRLALAAAKNGDTFGGEVIGGWDWGPRRQTILCSATIREDVQKLAGTALHNPLTIKGAANDVTASIAPRAIQSSPSGPSAAEDSAPTFTPPSQLSQKYFVVPLKLRLVTLVALLRAILTQAQRAPAAGNKIIVFFSCTDSVDFHWELLKGASMDQEGEDEAQRSSEETEQESNTPVKIPVLTRSTFLPNTSIFRLHGSLPLPARQAAVKGFSMTSSTKPSKANTPNLKPKAEMSILFCTSVASRGLDLPAVRSVVQYDLPTEGGATEYVHRVGRTARVGKGGEAWAFVAPEEIEWVTWVEEGMEGKGAADASESRPSSSGKISAGKLVPVDYEKTLLSGFGGSSKGEAGQRATDIQLAFERWVLKGKSHTALAQKGFQSHMRAYATHPSNEKHIFHVRNLHLGHLAKAFALRDAPSNIKSGVVQSSTSAAPKQAMIPQTERMKAKAKYMPGNKKDATGANSIAPRTSKVKERMKKKLTVSERMQEVMKSQGRLTKKDGHIVSGGGADEFQVAGGDALERLAH
ncbi:ATP-dependent RNA helicase dbp7 [Tulasnella sp. 427]|nr:ATP-dependent RNA helicase dbp7 [Tulasnella sp. 427]